MATLTEATEVKCKADFQYLATCDGGAVTIARKAEDDSWIDVGTMADGEQKFFQVRSFGERVRVTPSGASVDFDLSRVDAV
jgi:hypothetical protein